jgi:hypothetical protein
MSSFVFAESSGLSSGSATAGSLAVDTDVVGAQAHAAGLPVCGPGGDPLSQALTTSVKSCTSQVGTQFQDAAQLQKFYSEAIAAARATYQVVDGAGAAALSQAAPGGTLV